MDLRCVVSRLGRMDGVERVATVAWQVGIRTYDRPWGTCWWWGYSSPPSAMVCADCAGLRRGNTGDSRVVVNEFDVVAVIVVDLELCVFAVSGKRYYSHRSNAA
jgi:hypothetical protein